MNIRSAIFHRLYARYSGGHQKVLDYFAHMSGHPAWEPWVYLAGEQPLDRGNPWSDWRENLVAHYQPMDHQLAFLAGVDWRAYLPMDRPTDQPVVNLIQHVRHADPSADVYPFLAEKAIRICVSAEVETAILDTGMVNGPTFTIANGVDQDQLAGFSRADKTHDIYILGAKKPALAKQLAERLGLTGLSLLVHAEHVPREAVLKAMADSRICILLPNVTEGFYLPALESMALGALTVVPDCVGNRGFCHHEVNCLMPALQLDALLAAVESARQLLAAGTASQLLEQASKTLEGYTLERERQQFYDILDNLEQIW